MESYFELAPGPGEADSVKSASWPPQADFLFNLPPDAAASSSMQQQPHHKRSRDDELHPAALIDPDALNVLQYDPSAPDDDDEYIDPEEAGPMEEGESVLRLGGARRPAGGGGSPKKKRAGAGGQRLLSEVQVDEDGKTVGRRKIQIEYIQDKSRRHITFSKRKAGIMKKAYELSTLTGTQVLLLVVSENGTVYTYTTDKLQPMVTEAVGKNLIRECLDAATDLSHQTSELKHGGHVALKARMTKKPSASSLRQRVDPPPPLPLGALAPMPHGPAYPHTPPAVIGSMPAYPPMPQDVYQHGPADMPEHLQHHQMYYPPMPASQADMYGQYVPASSDGAYM